MPEGNPGVRAVLFDLDDTLLYSDMENAFLDHYFALLAEYARPEIAPKVLMGALMSGTQAMFANDEPDATNEQAFARVFAPLVGKPWSELKKFFDVFYEERFPRLRAYARPHADSRRVVQYCFDAGCAVAIATNPIFPASAIEHRLVWAGVSDLPFALVTSYENMHSCKPAVTYYLEIAQYLNVPVASCCMVGNDVLRDIAPAQEAGMRTYLVDEWVTNDDPRVQPDRRGPLADLSSWLDAEAESNG
jgi:FMN phosphatase YigB (HAD superfamily)